MYEEPIFLDPVLKERIWGGSKLNDFGYQIPSSTTGECWGISAHQNGASTVKNGPLQGHSLREVWNNHRELFGDEKGEDFPLLVKVLDAAADLSVQVHPNDEQARQLEQGEAFGKTECWYVLDAEPGAKLILGHHAESKEELETKMKNGEWDELLREVPIQKGDFYYVPSGTIHAIGKGALILETQQSSDTTYRVYDYDRTDQQGNKRKLHLDKSLQVTEVPHHDAEEERTIIYENTDGKIEKLIESRFFKVYNVKVENKIVSPVEGSYILASVVGGEGTIKTENSTSTLKKGDHFIIPSSIKKYKLEGNLDLILSTR
ncbi:mannose-6-phosphate isomerase, class I [Alteribacillus sp. JSM 102045]|uniref:mannose-6-phosphate isomerase, class I n=1 Tax=Alteribacillus sp. JSM 102045 TaxID=1562101 RepID=UPI0035BFCFF0